MDLIDSSVCLTSRQGALETKGYHAAAKACGITHAVVAPMDALVTLFNEEANRQTAALIRRHPRRYSGLAVVNPWQGGKGAALLETAFRQGLAGLYLHPARQGFRLTETIVHPLMDVCARFRKPVYCHTGTPVCSEPFQLAELARRFPGVPFVMGHAAWSDFSGYDVMPAMRQAPNILVETSCTTGALVAEMIRVLGPDRVLFGSGHPRSHPRVETDKLTRLNLATAIRARVMAANARQLWAIRS